MLLVHAKEVLDRQLGQIKCPLHDDAGAVLEWLTVKQIEVASEGYRIVLTSEDTDLAVVTSPSALHDNEVYVDGGIDPAIKQGMALEFYLPSGEEGDVIDTLEKAGLDIDAINVAAYQRAMGVE